MLHVKNAFKTGNKCNVGRLAKSLLHGLLITINDSEIDVNIFNSKILFMVLHAGYKRASS